jgi:hypothetical protein
VGLLKLRTVISKLSIVLLSLFCNLFLQLILSLLDLLTFGLVLSVQSFKLGPVVLLESRFFSRGVILLVLKLLREFSFMGFMGVDELVRPFLRLSERSSEFFCPLRLTFPRC